MGVADWLLRAPLEYTRANGLKLRAVWLVIGDRPSTAPAAVADMRALGGVRQYSRSFIRRSLSDCSAAGSLMVSSGAFGCWGNGVAG